jgi:hypothetical protein
VRPSLSFCFLMRSLQLAAQADRDVTRSPGQSVVSADAQTRLAARGLSWFAAPTQMHPGTG